MTNLELSMNDSVALLRRHLAKAFPGVRFTVKQCRGSARGWVDVGYVDGPAYDAVREVAGPFETQGFDGIADSTFAKEPGVAGSSIHQVSIRQTFSDARREAIVADLRTRWDGQDGKFACAAYSIMRGLDEEYSCTFHGLNRLP